MENVLVTLEKEPHYIDPIFTLLHLTEGQFGTQTIARHAMEMGICVQKILNTLNITYSEDIEFLQKLEKSLPFAHYETLNESSTEIRIYLLAKSLKNHDLNRFLGEMVDGVFDLGLQLQHLYTKQFTFSFSDHLKNGFFISEIVFSCENEASFYTLRDKMSSFTQELILGATSRHHAKQILVTRGLSNEHKIAQIHKTIVELLHRRPKIVGADILFEMHHFLLASDEEFKRIRQLSHHLRIIVAHNWFRHQLHQEGRQKEQKQRKIYCKVMRSSLHFEFGTKKVLGLVISVSYLSDYEQFDSKHILKAALRLIPNIKLVPHSFIFYETPSDSINSFYLEIEKSDGKNFTLDEQKQLRLGLIHELSLSIEQLSHKLFMPHNEEEVLRNIMLLSNEIRFVKDMPQIIISFRGQSESTLSFHVTLVCIVKDASERCLETLFKQASDFLTFASGTTKIIGYVRNKHAKEANAFFVECQKAPFLRQDHSVDLLRAREFVLLNVQKVFGPLRDFNGGLIGQQNQLLYALKEELTDCEKKQELHLENLFHSLTPVLMKSLLLPELILTLFRTFIELNKTPSKPVSFQEVRSDQALLLIVRSEDPSIFSEVGEAIKRLQFKEVEIAQSSFKVGVTFYEGYIVVPQSESTIDRFSEVVYPLLNESCIRYNSNQRLKISLPRPTSTLDPRIGTDKTSGIVIKMLYEGLMRIGPDGVPVYAIAESVQISPDQKNYIFSLRKTKWSNGLPVTAHDFEYAWKKILDQKFKSLFAYLLFPIKNAKEIKKGKLAIENFGVKALDDYTLSCELEHPAPYFLELAAHWIYSPLCKEVDEQHPGWAYYGGDTFVCNGPFRLVKWKRHSEIQVVKNLEYWDKEQVRLNQIDISIIESPKTALSQFHAGELDWIGEPLTEIPTEEFKKKEHSELIHSHPIAAVHWFNCNCKVKPFVSKKCRLALAIALNRREMINELWQEGEMPAYSILPATLSLSQSQHFYDNDKELARKLFHEGLEEQGTKLKDIGPISIYCCNQELHEETVRIASKQLKEVLEIDVNIKSYTWEKFTQKWIQRDYQLISTTWYSWFNDPIYNLESFKYSSSIINFTQWEDPHYIDLLNNAERCINPTERNTYLMQAENFIMQEMPAIPLFYFSLKFMKKDSVQNVALSHLGQIDFKWAFIKNL